MGSDHVAKKGFGGKNVKSAFIQVVYDETVAISKCCNADIHPEYDDCQLIFLPHKFYALWVPTARSKADTGPSTLLVGVPNLDYPQTYKTELVVEIVWKYRVAQKNVYTLYSSISLE